MVMMPGLTVMVNGDRETIRVVDLRPETRDPDPERTIFLAVRAGAGLENREGQEGSLVYAIYDSDDLFWLEALLPGAKREEIEPLAFMGQMYAKYGALLFDSGRQDLLPSVATMAGVLSLVPVDATLRAQLGLSNATVRFDALTQWKSLSTEQVVNATAQPQLLAATSSLAFQSGALLADGYLADWIVGQRLFAQYLPDACVPGSQDKGLLRGILSRAPWPLPVRVYGYNSLDPVLGGDLFEAETDCFDTLGQIASSHAPNLQFWSRVRPFSQGVPPLAQSPSPAAPAYSPSAAYVALVYGDMDNLDFVFSFGRQHMMERVRGCSGAHRGGCFPFTWTMSPNLVQMAPAVLRWYYAMAAQTSTDWFIMPPSGTLYSYPGEMPPAVQADYVTQQNAQAAVMGTSGSIHWEWVFTWEAAWKHYFPRYLNTSGTRLFFLNNVPWLIPIPDLALHHDTYRVIASPDDPSRSVIGFKPAFNWQLDGPSGGDPSNATVIADRINRFPLGSVQYVYIIQNTPFSAVQQMVSLLAPHVQLVNYLQLGDLALQRSASKDKRDPPVSSTTYF